MKAKIKTSLLYVTGLALINILWMNALCRKASLPAFFRRYCAWTAKYRPLISSSPHLLIFLTLLTLACTASPPTREAWIEATAHKNLGLAYLDRNDYEAAVTEFERVRALIPDDPLGHANLAIAHLRRQNMEEASRAITRAVDVAGQDAGVRAIQADVLAALGDQGKSAAILREAVQYPSVDVVVRYKYVKLLQRRESASTNEIIEQLRLILAQGPGNLAILIELGEWYIRAGRYEDAAETYELVKMLLNPVQENIGIYLDVTRSSLSDRNAVEARRNAGILGNLLKIDPAYRTSRDVLGDPSEQSPPIYDFRTAPADLIQTAAGPIIPMRFTEATEERFDPTTLESVRRMNPTSLRLTDYDMDGRLDLALLDQGKPVLFHNDGGRWRMVSTDAGLSGVGGVQGLAFGDIDNDGDQDIYLMKPDRDILYRNDGATGFSPLQNSALTHQDKGLYPEAIFLDYDHDGDLDILRVSEKGVHLYRNVDGLLFEEATGEATLALRGNSMRIKSGPSVAYGDFDLDGALDILLADVGEHPGLYRNLRQGRLEDATTRFGLQGISPQGVVISGDFNNDGTMDIFLSDTQPASVLLLWNRGDGSFDTESTPASLAGICGQIRITTALPLDFDNDGFLDLAVAGGEETSGWGLRLARNLGNGRFEDASHLLPEAIRSARILAVEAGDPDQDGDIDLIIAEENRLTVLRNDGGNANHWMDVQLAAATTGSSKNNYYGLGATIELNTKTHYQSRVVTSPITHFGLGSHERADVMRVLWPNGVPQNRVKPEPEERIIEPQRLKGSCPSLYTWDGEKYVFVTHLMTRSAIGAITDTGMPSAPDAANDHVKIRGDQMKPVDGKYVIKVVEELWDAVYMDATHLLVVDHPSESDIYVDEKYLPPPYPDLALFTVTKPRLPQSATDHHGHDIRPHLIARDTLYAGDYALSKYQGLGEIHSITLDPGDIRASRNIRLYLCGWIMPIEPSSNLAIAQQGGTVIPPYLEVKDAVGQWRKVIDYTGFPSGEHKTMIIDLTNKFLSDDHRVRITTNLQIYWSEAFFTFDEPDDIPITVTRLRPERAGLHYRGFSREYRTASNGPYLRDYSRVSRTPQWLPFEGFRTRFGEVTPLLQASDDRYVVFSSGEEAAITFDASALPPLKKGYTRDFVLHTDGWLKEGDLNTDTAATIEPLPFHGMSRYPYGPGEGYPATPDHEAYQEIYNTRWVSQKRFRQMVRRVGDGFAGIEARSSVSRDGDR